MIPNLIISKPERFDILLGRGKGFFEWEGNIRFMDIVSKYQEAYQNTKKGSKDQIFDMALEEILTVSGEEGSTVVRFLKKISNNKYQVATSDEVSAKVKHRLREKTFHIRKPIAKTAIKKTKKNETKKPRKVVPTTAIVADVEEIQTIKSEFQMETSVECEVDENCLDLLTSPILEVDEFAYACDEDTTAALQRNRKVYEDEEEMTFLLKKVREKADAFYKEVLIKRVKAEEADDDDNCSTTTTTTTSTAFTHQCDDSVSFTTSESSDTEDEEVEIRASE